MIFTKTNRSLRFIIIALFSLLLLFTGANVVLANNQITAAVNNPAAIGATAFTQDNAPRLIVHGLDNVKGLELTFTNAKWAGDLYEDISFKVSEVDNEGIVTITFKNNPTYILIPLITTINNPNITSSVTISILGADTDEDDITIAFTTDDTSININKGNDEEEKNSLTIINPTHGTLVKIGGNTYVLNIAETDANGNTLSQTISFAGTPQLTIIPSGNNAVGNSQVTVIDESSLTGSTSADGESIIIKLSTGATGEGIFGLMVPPNAKMEEPNIDSAFSGIDITGDVDFILGQHKESYPPLSSLHDIPFEMPDGKIMNLSLHPISAIYDEGYEFNIDLAFPEGHSAADKLILTAPTGFVWQQTEEIAITGLTVDTITSSEDSLVLTLSFTANADTLEDIALEGLKLMPTADAAKGPVNVELEGFGFEANLIVGYYSEDGELSPLPEGIGAYQNSAANQQNSTYTTNVDIYFAEEHSFEALNFLAPHGFEWINTDRITVLDGAGSYVSSNVAVNGTNMIITFDRGIDTDGLIIEYLALQPTETADPGDVTALLSVGDALSELPINMGSYEGPPEQPEQQTEQPETSVNNSVTGSNFTFTIGSNELAINDETIIMDVVPYIDKEDSSMYVPLRFMLDAFGFSHENLIWNGDRKTATIVINDTVHTFTVGSNIVTVNDEEQILHNQNNVPLTTKLVNGRTVIPLRPVSELLGAEVIWNQSTMSASIER